MNAEELSALSRDVTQVVASATNDIGMTQPQRDALMRALFARLKPRVDAGETWALLLFDDFYIMSDV
jgi:hypothetical protein